MFVGVDSALQIASVLALDRRYETLKRKAGLAEEVTEMFADWMAMNQDLNVLFH